MSALRRCFAAKIRIHGKSLFTLAVVSFAAGCLLGGCSDSLEKTRITGVNTKALAIINPELCTGCGICFPACPQRAIDSVVTPNPDFPDAPFIDFLIDTDKCTRCGVCFQACQFAAIGWKR